MISPEADFKIIVIDDNQAIHRDFIKILKSATSGSALDTLGDKMFGNIVDNDTRLPNFEIDTASQGKEGVERIREELLAGNHYSLAFVDIRMPPGWDGIETIKHIWELDKDIQVVICTAYSDYSWEETVAHLGKTDNLLILKKPFDNISVRQLACALTKKWQLLQDTRKFTTSLKDQISERTHSLEKSLSLVKATLESSDEGIVVISEDKKIIDFNQKFMSMWGINTDFLKDRNSQKLIDHLKEKIKNSDELQKWLDDIFKHTNSVNIDLIKLQDGRIFECYSQPQKVNGNIVGRVLNFRDITEKIRLLDNLHHQATHDALTGLPNRVHLIDKLKESIQNAEENKSLVAVFFFDLDRFKLINDSLSHEAGDDLLRQTADRIRSSLCDSNTLARIGGDEFVLIASNVKEYNDITKKASELISLFSKPFNILNRDVTITTSIGVSIYPSNGETIDALLRNADAAMYHAKEMGANNFQFYTDELNEKSLEKLDKEMQLRQAIDNNEFFLCYQPQYDINTQKLSAVEALLRWRHPTQGILLPIDFIPLAEETGLIVTIGEWVLRTACKQIKQLHNAGNPDVRVAINLTGQQFKQQNLVELMKSIIAETKLDAKFIELELTENIILSNMSVINTVKELKKLGVTIAIDDFGTGYSSLSYLKRIPLDRLKIDSSFIRQIQSDSDGELIIRAIIALAKNLNLEVLAEGVETQNQLDFLKNQNCSEIQGFYLSKPLTMSELEKIAKLPPQTNILKADE